MRKLTGLAGNSPGCGVARVNREIVTRHRWTG